MRRAIVGTKRNTDAAHERGVQRRYGLFPGEYARMLAEQDGRCAICMNRPAKQRLAVDHDHKTGKVRALICSRCNRALGQFENDPVRASNASRYLEAIAEDGLSVLQLTTNG